LLPGWIVILVHQNVSKCCFGQRGWLLVQTYLFKRVPNDISEAFIVSIEHPVEKFVEEILQVLENDK
jgi:hypothetical protein